jgi:hypothetical protein
MEWSRAILIACTCTLAALVIYESTLLQQLPLPDSNTTSSVSIGHSPTSTIAAQERIRNRERRAIEDSVTYPFYTISPRYYYQNSPYHQSRYSYYNGFRYFYPNYDPPTYYYGSPFSVGLSLQIGTEPGEETPTTLTPENPE